MKKIQITYLEPGGIIWKIIPDNTHNYLVVESRDGKLRKIILSALDISKEKMVFKNEQLPIPWWLGLKAVGYNAIILQGYKESNSPEPKGVYVFELTSGKLLWQKEDFNFYSFVDKERLSLMTLGNEQISFFEVGLLNGSILKESSEIGTNEIVAPLSVQSFPLLYNEDNLHYKTIVDFLKTEFDYACVGPLEYLEFEKYIVISFYIKENNKFTNMLVVLDENGECICKDTLMEGAEGVGMASFFICSNKLIYVKNKSSIGLIDLL